MFGSDDDLWGEKARFTTQTSPSGPTLLEPSQNVMDYAQSRFVDQFKGGIRINRVTDKPLEKRVVRENADPQPVSKPTKSTKDKGNLAIYLEQQVTNLIRQVKRNYSELGINPSVEIHDDDDPLEIVGLSGNRNSLSYLRRNGEELVAKRDEAGDLISFVYRLNEIDKGTYKVVERKLVYNPDSETFTLEQRYRVTNNFKVDTTVELDQEGRLAHLLISGVYQAGANHETEEFRAKYEPSLTSNSLSRISSSGVAASALPKQISEDSSRYEFGVALSRVSIGLNNIVVKVPSQVNLYGLIKDVCSIEYTGSVEEHFEK